VDEADTSETVEAIVHRLPASKLGYCAWVRARNCSGASKWSKRFIFHYPVSRPPPSELLAAPSTTEFKINPFSAPFISCSSLHSSTQAQTNSAELGYSQRSRVCSALNPEAIAGALQKEGPRVHARLSSSCLHCPYTRSHGEIIYLSLAGKDVSFAGSSRSGALVSLTDDGWVLNTVPQVAGAEGEQSTRLAYTSTAGSCDDDPAVLSTFCTPDVHALHNVVCSCTR
jgi:hypothetical protein